MREARGCIMRAGKNVGATQVVAGQEKKMKNKAARAEMPAPVGEILGLENVKWFLLPALQR